MNTAVQRINDGSHAADQKTVGRSLSAITSFIPVVGQIKDVHAAYTGTDFISEDEMAGWERGLAATAVVAVVAKPIATVAKPLASAGTELAVDTVSAIARNAGAADEATVVDDVAQIAENTRMPEYRIQRIKDHVFYTEHNLGGELKRFDPDFDMAEAWDRHTNGTFDGQDLALLDHEYFESKYMGIFDVDYAQAHKAALDRGYVWE